MVLLTPYLTLSPLKLLALNQDFEDLWEWFFEIVFKMDLDQT